MDPNTTAFARQEILGVGVSLIDMTMALEAIQGWIASQDNQYVCVAPAHAIMDAYKSKELREILNKSGLVTPDGMGIVWLLKLSGHRQVSRVYGPDLVLAACEFGVELGYRHYLYGGEGGVSSVVANELMNRVAGVQIVGTSSPPPAVSGTEVDEQAVEIINSTAPDIVWVGLGSPKQEFWMANHVGRIRAPVLIGVGAAFDFLAGRKPQAPRWVQRGGMEWLFRLLTEPRRLWPRYRQYPRFFLLAISQLLGIKNKEF